jgi:ribose 5-phosphate isomerase A
MIARPALPLSEAEIALAKARVAKAAVDEIRDGMIVGLGTGSTAALAIEALGHRVAEGLVVTTVATSLASARLAISAGITVVPFDDIARIDIAIDGADEIDAGFRAIKGGGGALLREKIVARSAEQMICIVDAGKVTDRLGRGPVPVEVLPFARTFVTDAIQSLWGEARLRQADNRLAITDQGNLLLDCSFADLPDPEKLAWQLQNIPGLIAHGLFLSEIDVVLLGERSGVSRHRRV